MWFAAQFGHTGILAQFIGFATHTKCIAPIANETDWLRIEILQQNKTIAEEIHFFADFIQRMHGPDQLKHNSCNKTAAYYEKI